MKLQTALRAFLAARFPCAFDEAILRTRIARSGALDSEPSPEGVRDALSTLSSRYRHAECLVDPDGNAAWSATPAGVAAWHEQGSPNVGG